MILSKKEKKLSQDIYQKELATCKKLSNKNNGKCNWGVCKNCGVIPLLHKLYKGKLLESPKSIKKVKDKIFCNNK